MKSRRQRRSPPSPSADAMSAVLGNDDLVREIILRLGFPTSLVRAALVCKRWLRLASDPAFLRRFRELHPPRLLGFYVATRPAVGFANFVPIRPQFVQMLPQPPEFASVLRRGNFSVDTYESLSTSIMDCRNGSVLISLFRGGFTRGVHTPLRPEKGMTILLPCRPGSVQDDTFYNFSELLSKEGGDGLPLYFWLSMEFNQGAKATAHAYMFQDGVWRLHASAVEQLPEMPPSCNILLVDNKIYMAGTVSSMLVLDLTASTFSTVELPEGVEYEDGEIMLSQAENSGVYLIHVKELQLRIWFHRGDNGNSIWLLVDTISLRELFATLGMSNRTVEDDRTADVLINQVGDNAEFVFLEIGGCLLYLDTKSRALQKVYEVTEEDRCLTQIHPFMMIWPPTFPALKESCKDKLR